MISHPTTRRHSGRLTSALWIRNPHWAGMIVDSGANFAGARQYHKLIKVYWHSGVMAI